jgi:hypothetical protein
VYGTLTDVINGEELPDTDDERIRQDLARLLLERGFSRQDIEPRLTIETLVNQQFVRSVIDLCLRSNRGRALIIRYGPGSLTTRQRPTVAAARILDPAHQIPLAVVTNGREAELIETAKGQVLAHGLEAAIPNPAGLTALLAEHPFRPPPDARQRLLEERILNAFDVQVCCRAC